MSSQLQAIHLGEQDVRHNQCHLVFQAAGDGKGLLPVLRREDVQPLIHQRLCQDTAKDCVILDKQHRLVMRMLDTHLGHSIRRTSSQHATLAAQPWPTR